jgi:hypothetical protein
MGEAGMTAPSLTREQQEAVAWKLVRGDEVADPFNRVMVEQAYRLLPAGFAIAQILIPDAHPSVEGQENAAQERDTASEQRSAVALTSSPVAASPQDGLAEELTEAAEGLRDGGGPACMNDPITADLLDRAAAALRAREAQPSEGAQRDAERYRWLRDEAEMMKKDPCVMRYGWPEDVICGEELDAAIDAALSRRPA